MEDCFCEFGVREVWFKYESLVDKGCCGDGFDFDFLGFIDWNFFPGSGGEGCPRFFRREEFSEVFDLRGGKLHLMRFSCISLGVFIAEVPVCWW